MIRRNPLGINRPSMHLDDRAQELTEDIPHFFDLVMNDITGAGQDFHNELIPSHWHREMEAFLMMAGRAQMVVDGETYEVEPGQAYFINSEALHAFTFLQGPVEYRSFLFDPGIVGGAPGSVFDSVYVRPLQERGARVLAFNRQEEGDWLFFEAFSRIFQLCRDQPPGYEFAVRDALSQMVLLAKHKGQIAPPRASHRRTGKTGEGGPAMDGKPPAGAHHAKGYFGPCEPVPQGLPKSLSEVPALLAYGIPAKAAGVCGGAAAVADRRPHYRHCAGLRLFQPQLLFEAV